MLKELYIKNVAIIDEAVIDFEKGFNVLTGETGAGKSILIDSINMVIGSRSSKDIVRTGADKAIVNATFEVSSKEIEEKLSDFGIETEDGDVILSRQISAEGKSVCRCNGVMLPLNCIREIGELLVDIHGQHDNQKIMDKGNHIGYLDEYGKYNEIISDYKRCYEEYKNIISELEELNIDKEESNRRLDLISYQINEIETAKLKKDEDIMLEERREFLSNAEKIISEAESAYEALYEAEYQSSAFDLVMKANKNLSEIRDFDANLSSYAERLESALAEIEDISGELKAFLNKTDYSAEELNATESRLDVINGLKRKYGNSIEDINSYLASIKEEHEKFSFSEENIRLLQEKKALAEEKLDKLARKLSGERKKFAKDLEEKICKELADLDMPAVRFVVAVNECEYSKNGTDKIEFLISANAGEELKPMSKIASGGELSRIMLAIKSVMKNDEHSETMIFDEIDTGVSGRAAQKIAEKIAGFSGECQVFAVTHLSQIAAMADTHFLIKKENDGEKTFTKVNKLSKDDRVEELGRIIGGVSVTETTLKSAEEMLEMAEKMKSGR